MIEEHLQRDGHIIYHLDGLHSRVVVANFGTPERAAAWLDAWQDHAALEAERDALAVQFDMEREEHRKSRVALRLWQEQAADLRKERDALAAKVARVEALAAQWEADAANARESFSADTSRNVHFYSAFLCGGHAEDLRAALASPAPAPDIHAALAAEMADLHEALANPEVRAAFTDLRTAPDAHPLPPDHPAWDAADAALRTLAADAEQQAAYDALEDEDGE